MKLHKKNVKTYIDTAQVTESAFDPVICHTYHCSCLYEVCLKFHHSESLGATPIAHTVQSTCPDLCCTCVPLITLVFILDVICKGSINSKTNVERNLFCA